MNRTRADYVLALITARCPELTDEDLAVLSQPEPLGEPLTPEIADEILNVVLALDDRMAKLEAKVPNSADIVATVWDAMRDFTLREKQAMLDKLEGLVGMEEASHSPIQ